MFLALLTYLQRKRRTYYSELEYKMQKYMVLRLYRSYRLVVRIRVFYARPTLRTYRASLCVLLLAFLNRQGITFYYA